MGILHFAYKEVSVGRSNAAARGKKKGEGNGGAHHPPLPPHREKTGRCGFVKMTSIKTGRYGFVKITSMICQEKKLGR